MKLGNKSIIILILFSLQLSIPTLAEEKILSSPLINLNEIKPSFEDTDDKIESIQDDRKLKNKKIKNKNKTSQVTIIGLDKITAKSSEMSIDLNKVKIFGPLEIKILKCGKIKNNNKLDDVAYMQVKDTSKNDNEKVFIFNGWTFASDPSLTPFDHAIYDLQLLSCNV